MCASQFARAHIPEQIRSIPKMCPDEVHCIAFATIGTTDKLTYAEGTDKELAFCQVPLIIFLPLSQIYELLGGPVRADNLHLPFSI
jgi:hypothetical protein